MNQSNRTLVYVGIAVVAIAVAFFSRPEPVAVELTEESTSLLLFPEFKDPTTAASLSIKRFNEDKLSFDEFAVVEKGGVWTLPSHENYPADAKDQVVKAATLLSDLRLTGIETDAAEAQERERYGLLEPTIENFQKAGGASLGTHVIVQDAAKKELANLIIGKEVPGKSDQRYVSVPGKNRIATIKVDTTKLSTKFSDWIETDLLKLGSVFDVTKLSLHDYSVDPDRGPQNRALMTFERPEDKNEWQIVEMKKFDEEAEKYVEALPGEGEELNSQKIDDMRSALGELKIVNVEKKPAKFRESLAATGDVNLTQETARSLQRKGFYLVPAGGDEDNPAFAVVSTDGELTVTMKDGVEYLLRFGAVADFDKEGNPKPKDATSGSDAADAKDGETKDGEKKDDEKKDGEDSDDDGGISLNRYLFVTVQYNDEMIEKPVLEKLPGETPAEPPMETPAETPMENPADDSATPNGDTPKEDTPPGDEKTDSGAKPADDTPAEGSTPKQDDAKDGERKSDEARTSAGTLLRLTSFQDEDAKKDDANKDEAEKEVEAVPEQPKADVPPATPSTDPASGDEKAVDPAKADETKPTETAPEEGAKPADAPSAPAVPNADAPKPSPEDAAKKLEAEKTRVEAENKRMQEEYDEKVKEAQKKVKELNERFAEWYYVIPEDVYKKIHLGRDDVVKKKEPAAPTTPGGATPPSIHDLPPGLGPM
jgi:hypothetical protein